MRRVDASTPLLYPRIISTGDPIGSLRAMGVETPLVSSVTREIGEQLELLAQAHRASFEARIGPVSCGLFAFVVCFFF